MRVAAIYDIHANLPALEAVVEEIRRVAVDRIVVGGDVLPGPMPRESIAYLLNLEIPVQFIRGNGDREVLASMRGTESASLPEAALEQIRWNARQLEPEHEELLASWPETTRVSIKDGTEVLFCHATPRNDTDIFTRLTTEESLAPIFDGLGISIVVCGHTHMQFERMVGSTRVLNAGSVGMPFGEPGAYWLLLGEEIEFRRTSYALDEAAGRVIRTNFPGARHFAEHFVIRPPSEAQMLEIYRRVELK